MLALTNKRHWLGRLEWHCTALVVFLTFAVMAGCAAGPYGRLQRDPDVTRMFDTNTVPNGYHYYTTGRTHLPYAIIGIDPRYRFASDDWHAIEPNTQDFAQRVAFIWRPDVWDRLETAKGAWITDSQGNKVGLWYSMYPYTTIIVGPDRRVEVYSPFWPDE
ncbi:MAG: hypothetical protein C4519_21370 [Desulfobacteraceae bacterium]|nr:MAG: hypothetical protein C4519_21370 [Desulfobacteraceae bacterium]